MGGTLISVADNVVVEGHGHTTAADIAQAGSGVPGVEVPTLLVQVGLDRVECTDGRW